MEHQKKRVLLSRFHRYIHAGHRSVEGIDAGRVSRPRLSPRKLGILQITAAVWLMGSRWNVQRTALRQRFFQYWDLM